MSINLSTNYLPPSHEEEWVTNTIYFHRFADLSTPKGEHVKSNKFICFGSEWSVWAYPRGDRTEGRFYVSLNTLSNRTVKVDYVFTINSRFRGIVKTLEFHPYSVANSNLIARKSILASLVRGELVVGVRMRLPPFIPHNPSACKTIQKMFMDEEYADITFEIGGGIVGSSLTLFHAHRIVLTKAAPQLEELCVPCISSPVPYPHQFYIMLVLSLPALLLCPTACRIKRPTALNCSHTTSGSAEQSSCTIGTRSSRRKSIVT